MGVLVISAATDYQIACFKEKGYGIEKPYLDKTLIGRVFREIWFRLGFKKSVWFNKAVLNYDVDEIIVLDTLIVSEFLLWLQKKFPNTQITYSYTNLVGKSKSLYPNEVPKGINLSTYDQGDSEKYSMKLSIGGEFPACNLRKHGNNIFDVFYVGCDKGRGEYVLSLKDKLEKMGLKTKIIITKDGRLSKPKSYYSRRISYEKVLDYDCHSKAIMNIVVPGQKGATLRDFEALFLKCKLITNNSNIKSFDFYCPENIFIIGEDSFSDLPAFINSPFKDIGEDILRKHLNY